MTDLIRTAHHGPVAEIILHRPEKRNALTWPMLEALAAALAAAERLPGVRALLLRGEGPGFSAGIDLGAFADLAERYGPGWQAHMLNITAAFQHAVGQAERCTVPTIAVLHGFALGLGLEVALACDFRLAAEGTRLGLPETRLGLIPDVGGTTRLARLAGPARAKELILTGRQIDAATAEGWGLLTAVTPADELRDAALKLAGEIALAAPLAIAAAKRVIDELADLDRGLHLEAWAQRGLVQTEDFATGVAAAAARQMPAWQGR
jgi:enoyl-CoA hydratase/carnithine racemase